jgi:hypothetical protein
VKRPQNEVSSEEVGPATARTVPARDQPRRSVTDMQIVADLSPAVQQTTNRGVA